MRRYLTLMFLALFLFVHQAQAQDKPFSFATTPGQLPKTAVPRHYAIQVTPNLTDMTTTGSETVALDVLTPTPTLVCNIRNLSVSAATVDGQPATFAEDDKGETVTITAAQTLAIGPHSLSLTFAGHIIRQPEGLYYIKYKDPDGTARTMLGTQMEATDARRLFPCWDEPVYRATYQLTVTVPQDFTAVSNMPIASETPGANGVKTVAFQPTPPMASYLTAFVAGDLESVSGKTSDGIPVSVVTTRGKKASAEYALSVIEKLLPFYDSYFGIKFPLPKMDLIAVPGGFPGAMENWGAIVYNESTLLYDPAKSSQGRKETVFHVVAHETAHQWFGDLVTMAWWDDIWLNEGFASWMDLKATDHFNPDWHVWLRSADAKYAAMSGDARLTTHPVQQHLTSPGQIDQAFDNITYDKGANVIRMVETYLGPDAFQRGIQAYIGAHKYSNTTTADLWNALSKASGQNVTRIAGSFTDQPGFPLVTASAACKNGQQTLTLSQTRFLISGTPPQVQQWQVPVVIAQPPTLFRDKVVGTVLLLTGTQTSQSAGTCGTPIIVNSGNIGYYRVKYVGPLWDAVRKAAPTLAPADQLALLSDRWALVEADQATAPEYLDLTQSLRDSDQLVVWQEILGTVERIDALEAGDPARPAFRAYALGLLRPLMARLGRDAKPGEDEAAAVLRPQVIAALGDYGDPDTLAWAHDRFAAFLADSSSLPPNVRGTVLDIVGHSADQSTYDQLHALAKQATSFEDKQRYYNAMASAQDPALAQQTLALSLTDELPSPFNAFLVYGVAGGGEQPALAWDFVQQHQKELDSRLDFSSRLSFVPNLMGMFTDPARADELLAYSKASLPPDAKRSVDRAVGRIRSAAALKQRELPRIDAWLQEQKTASR